MKILACFYVGCTSVDWVTFLSGQATLRNKDILCYNNTIILVNSNLGSFYMMVYEWVCYGYAFFMWFIFYQVPKKFGVVSRRSVDDVDMIIGDESTIIHDEENLKTVVRELDYDRRFTRNQQNKCSSSNSDQESCHNRLINNTVDKSSSPTNTQFSQLDVL